MFSRFDDLYFMDRRIELQKQHLIDQTGGNKSTYSDDQLTADVEDILTEDANRLLNAFQDKAEEYGWNEKRRRYVKELVLQLYAGPEETYQDMDLLYDPEGQPASVTAKEFASECKNLAEDTGWTPFEAAQQAHMVMHAAGIDTYAEMGRMGEEREKLKPVRLTRAEFLELFPPHIATYLDDIRDNRNDSWGSRMDMRESYYDNMPDMTENDCHELAYQDLTRDVPYLIRQLDEAAQREGWSEAQTRLVGGVIGILYAYLDDTHMTSQLMDEPFLFGDNSGQPANEIATIATRMGPHTRCPDGDESWVLAGLTPRDGFARAWDIMVEANIPPYGSLDRDRGVRKGWETRFNAENPGRPPENKVDADGFKPV